jgi:hypothetical protein
MDEPFRISLRRSGTWCDHQRLSHARAYVAAELAAEGLDARCAPTLDEPDASAIALLIVLTQALDKHELARFELSGLGAGCWPVRVYPDLCTILEGLPYALAALQGGQRAELELYEQGFECVLRLDPESQNVRLRVLPFAGARRSWQPPERETSLATDDLLASLRAVLDSFNDMASSLHPAVTESPVYRAWLRLRTE